MSETGSSGAPPSRVVIIGIIVAGVVLLACIAAFTAILITFLMNAPW
jgi:hypothetical protein